MKKLKDILKKLTPILKKYRWCFVAIFIIILLVVFLYCIGFRITYAPELETSWNAVIAFANWGSVFVSLAGAIASFLAVWFAIKVPKQIADRQDKIALFEKRYNVYYLFADFRALSLYIVNTKDRISIQKFFLSSYNITWSNDKNDNAIKVSSQCTLIVSQMFQSKFLFNESIGMAIAHFCNLVINVITFSLDDNKTAELEQAQKILMLDINKNQKYMWILNQMESYLEITK